MTDTAPPPEFYDYFARCTAAWHALFDAAFQQNEVQAALALSPEFRGMQGAGWSTADEAHRARVEFLELLEELKGRPVLVRVAMSLYNHLSEASGFYEVPKNMLRLIGGEDYNMWPFQHLTARHAKAGSVVAPNANRVMKDLLGHSREVGQNLLEPLLLEAFDPDLRNGYSHADYIIAADGIRLRRRNGGQIRVVPLKDFECLLTKALIFFETLSQAIQARRESYATPKRLMGSLNSREPLWEIEIAFNAATGAFRIGTPEKR